MPVHAWSRLPAGAFHDFHSSWITHLKEALNGGVIADVLTLQSDEAAAVAAMRRTLAVRHVSGDRVVALIEIASPGNKDHVGRFDQFLAKCTGAIRSGVHLVSIDLLPPGALNPHGLAAAVWDSLSGSPYEQGEKPFAAASFQAEPPSARAFIEPLALGDALPDIPLFLDVGFYVNVPLESTYSQAVRGLPRPWRERLSG